MQQTVGAHPRIHLPSLGAIAGRLGGLGDRGCGWQTWISPMRIGRSACRGNGAMSFVVRAGEQGWCHTRLPFGWNYSLAVCQRVVAALVRSAVSAVRGLDVTTDLYLDNILVSATNPHLVRVAVERIVHSVHKLQRAGFIISPKSATKPAQRMIFISKCVHARKSTISNSPKAVAAALRIRL